MDPMNDYYGMEMWKQMLGLSANPYAPPQMQYLGQKQEQQKKQGGSNMNTQMLQSLMGGSTATGMTPNAVNSRGESFYGWGAKTGDWPAQAPLTADSGLIAGNEIAAPGAYAEVGSAADIGSASGGASGGTSLLGGLGYTAGWAGAGMGALHQATQANSRSFEGQATKDIFGGSYATDPWVPTAYEKLGIDTPTAGETFDARWQNKDYKGMVESFPRAGGYWASPVTSMGYDVVSDKFGSTVANMLFPDQWGLDQLGKLFGKLF